MASPEPRPLVAVVGLGAIGTRIAVALERAGRCELIGCARRAVDRRSPPGTFESAVEAALALGDDRLTSLEADLLAGRPTEVDARNGAVARFGRERNLDVRWNELARRILR